MSISSGVVADKAANADKAYDIGKAAAVAMTGHSYGDVKLKRKDQIKSIGVANDKVTVRGREVEVNSTLLFMRVACVIKHQAEMGEYLRHEFGSKPPALFDNGIMRKTVKSALANRLKSNVTPCSEGLENPFYIIDGGHLLHAVKWPRDCTYVHLCETYAALVINHYGTDSTVIFDGYTDRMSTKVAEQQRRATQHTSPDILFEPEMVASTPQNQFLGNRHNKATLITRLKSTLENAGISCSQSTADADHLISSTALTAAHIMDRPVILMGTDPDLLVMLVHKAIQSYTCSSLTTLLPYIT